MGGEYAGGAESLRCFGRRVGVVVAKGLVILLMAAGAGEDTLEEKDLAAADDDNIDDLDSFLEPNFFKLKGILYFEEVLVCEQNVGAGEMVIL